VDLAVIRKPWRSKILNRKVRQESRGERKEKNLANPAKTLADLAVKNITWLKKLNRKVRREPQ